jgi:hypothetical protein
VVKVATRAGVTRVEIDAARDFPDVDRTNQAWAAGQ